MYRQDCASVLRLGFLTERALVTPLLPAGCGTHRGDARALRSLPSDRVDKVTWMGEANTHEFN